MSAPQTPVWRQVPLAGTSLIEASAGTGKTWNIALLYLRLVLERGLGARRILVTTFTDAAAQELRARIRARLLAAERSVADSAWGDADIGAFLSERCAVGGRSAVLAQLRLALADIDTAPISTIHGFCRRVLSDFPFDTGMPFTLGEVVDEASLIRECVEDFWRRRYLVDAIDPWEALWVLPRGPEHLAALVSKLLGVPEAAWANGDARGVRAWWQTLLESGIPRLRAVIDDHRLYQRSNSALRSRLRELLEAVESGDLGAVRWKALGEALAPEALAASGNPRLATPLDRHPLLGPWGALAASMLRIGQVLAADVAQQCARGVAAELDRRLRAQGNTTFSQLIAQVHERLGAADAATLAARLRENWPVALIDEFQDTDTRQWTIFERIYRQADESGDSALILIGDPKQSIYAFRGADIHAYLAARDGLAAERQYSIDQNFRSHPRLLEALNGLYGLAGALDFGATGIRYIAVGSGKPAAFAGDACAQPLRLRLLQCEHDGVGARDRIALPACANDIVALLADPGSGVQPGDIAVLIDSNRRIEEMRNLLVARGVPVVGAGRASVLATAWADDLQLLLHALLQPNDEYAVRGALATRLLGVTARELSALAGDARAWEDQLDRFARWRRLWDGRGVLAVIEDVTLMQASRLLASADGERALTDLRHLGEVLQDAASECYGPEELYAWYVRERGGAGADKVEAGREQQLRIESEARRVQLLTIHASKGLEYPVVFVPTAWRAVSEHHRDIRREIARHHDAGHRLCLDLGSADFATHKDSERREDLQERLRALYVAMTRARSRCIVYAFADTAPRDAIGDSSRGALETLLGAALHAACAKFEQPASPWERLARAVPALAIDHEETGFRSHDAATRGAQERAARTPLPAARPHYGHYSFTALTRMAAPAASDAPQWAEDEPAEAGDRAPALAGEEAPEPRIAALARVRGPQVGNALHLLLEQGRAADGVPLARRGAFALQTTRIARALDEESVALEEGGEAAQLAAVADLLDRTLDSPLAPGLRLADLPATARRAEFEFAFAIDESQWHRLPSLLAIHGLGHWWPASAGKRVLRGLMKGYMDLVFAWDGRYHVLDYKTNWLGEGRLSDYHPDALDAAMLEHHYGLQALIYTVALHRYLGHRLEDYDPDLHIGESWYLFVRAVGLAPNAGIWRKRFPRALIEGLDALFEGAEVAA